MVNLEIRTGEIKGFGESDHLTPEINMKLYLQLSEREPYEKCKLLFYTMEIRAPWGIISKTNPIPCEEEMNQRQIDSSHSFQVPRYILASIEAKRKDDMELSIDLQGLALVKRPQTPESYEKVHGHYLWQLSHAKWSALLKQLEYREYWIIEIERPKFEGFDKIKEYLDDAQTKLEAHSYQEAVVACRDVFLSIEPIFNQNVEKIKAIIDEGCKGEEGHKNKSSCILALKNALDETLKKSAHRECYIFPPRESIMCYRMTVSFVAYLSEILSRIDLAKEK
jgi:hypothetical protein